MEKLKAKLTREEVNNKEEIEAAVHGLFNPAKFKLLGVVVKQPHKVSIVGILSGSNYLSDGEIELYGVKRHKDTPRECEELVMVDARGTVHNYVFNNPRLLPRLWRAIDLVLEMHNL